MRPDRKDTGQLQTSDGFIYDNKALGYNQAISDYEKWLLDILRDDGLAITCQSLGQYRNMIIRAIRG